MHQKRNSNVLKPYLRMRICVAVRRVDISKTPIVQANIKYVLNFRTLNLPYTISATSPARGDGIESIASNVSIHRTDVPYECLSTSEGFI